jgi:hypothetical protein
MPRKALQAAKFLEQYRKSIDKISMLLSSIKAVPNSIRPSSEICVSLLKKFVNKLASSLGMNQGELT